MRLTISIFTLAIFIFGCTYDPQEKAVIDKFNVSFSDTVIKDSMVTNEIKTYANKNQIEKADTGKKINNVVDYNPEYIVVKVTLNEIRIIDSDFRTQIDSLIKWEKKCDNSALIGLHWTFSSFGNGTYELTAASDFCNKYIGFTILDNSFVFMDTDLPELYQVTNKKKDFKFKNKKLPYPEDYSVWLFKIESKRIKIIESYTLPCD